MRVALFACALAVAAQAVRISEPVALPEPLELPEVDVTADVESKLETLLEAACHSSVDDVNSLVNEFKASAGGAVSTLQGKMKGKDGDVKKAYEVAMAAKDLVNVFMAAKAVMDNPGGKCAKEDMQKLLDKATKDAETILGKEKVEALTKGLQTLTGRTNPITEATQALQNLLSDPAGTVVKAAAAKGGVNNLF